MCCINKSEDSSSSEESDDEEYCMVASRSKRKRKEINYKFEDYDQIINSAILEESKETGPAEGKGFLLSLLLSGSLSPMKETACM